jgi:Ca-activated chloride channel family protein
MKSARIGTILVAVVIVAIALFWRSSDSSEPTATPTTTGATTAPDGAVAVTMAYSPEKKPLLEPLVAQFNASGAEVDGQKIFVTAEVVSSGAATDGIVAGTLQPVLWSPSSSLWGRLVNFRTDSALAPDQNPSLVRTPLVIAMWEPLARALGWPDKELGWSDILREARSSQGWGAYGHPEWGDFKFGHTNPDFSTSGLSAVAAEYLSAAGKAEGLTLADVKAPATRKVVQDIQKSVVHYGDTTLFFADRLAEFGPSYASAVAMEEVTLLDFNLKKAKGVERLAAIYPKEGTFFSDNPLIALNGSWVSEEQKKAAATFVAFLTDKVTPQQAASIGFRPADGAQAPLAPVTKANLVDPAQPTRQLGLPEPKVLNAIRVAWRADRKPAEVQVVLDVSGSMLDGGKFDAAKDGLTRFIQLLGPQDYVGLTVFSDRVTEVSPPVPLRTQRKELLGRVRGLVADGQTAVYDATIKSVDKAAARVSKDRINAVVVLTDGQDNSSTIGLSSLEQRLRKQSGSEGVGIRVFTIAYGDDAEGPALARVAKAGGGGSYSGDPATIEKVYTQIASFF